MPYILKLFSRIRPRVPVPMIAIAGLLTLALNTNARAGIALEKIADGLISPTVLFSLDRANTTLLIADQAGYIHVFKDGRLQSDLFLDLHDRLVQQNDGFDERGLVGLALHPDFKENRKVYVYYSAPLRDGGPAGWNNTGHLSEFRVLEDNHAKADPDSERILLQIDEPQFNHNSGRLAFGPEGYLYLSVGDGGQANDQGLGHGEQGNAQDVTKMLGKILRIDVNTGSPFGIPRDNPFVGRRGNNAIYAWGLRNPWGLSFDRGGAHELFVADVGQNSYEEVDIIRKGGNYGWRIREGMHGFDPDNPNKGNPNAPKVDASGEPLIDPILEYKNLNAHRGDPEALGISVTGGYVYRGKAIPELEGQYIFGDWSSSFAGPNGTVFAASRDGDQWTMRPLALDGFPDGKIGAFITAFGEDAEGELYVLTQKSNGLRAIQRPDERSGTVYKLVKN